MKKPNCILAILAAFIFVCSAFSTTAEHQASLYKSLEDKQREFGGAVKDYYKSVPKEEWLPLWEEILSTDSLQGSVTAWMTFAGEPFRFNDDLKYDKETIERLRSNFKEQCAPSNHFTISEFSDKLFEWFGHELNFAGFKKADEDIDQNPYNFYAVCDVLKLLGWQEKLNEITLNLTEELKSGDYSEFSGTTVIEPTLGDLSTYNYSCFPKKNDILEDWETLRDIANRYYYNTYDAFLKGLKETAVFHSNCFFITKFYCESLHDDKLAKEFLQSNFSLDKACTLTEAFPEYVELCKKLGVPLDKRYRTPELFQCLQWQLFFNKDDFCNQADWFWEDLGLEWYRSYDRQKKGWVKPILEGVEYPSSYVVRRLFAISDPEDFKNYLRKKVEKKDNDVCAFLAMLTNDPEEFEKCINIMSDRRRSYADCSYANKVGLSCIILNLKETFPATCAKPLLEMIKRSDLLSNPDAPFYGERFKKWCLAKNETEVAAEMDAMLKDVKPKETISISDYDIDLKGILENPIFASCSNPEIYFINHPRREWLPSWKSVCLAMICLKRLPIGLFLPNIL